MANCKRCGNAMERRKAESSTGGSYNYLKCLRCGSEVLDMSQ